MLRRKFHHSPGSSCRARFAETKIKHDATIIVIPNIINFCLRWCCWCCRFFFFFFFHFTCLRSAGRGKVLSEIQYFTTSTSLCWEASWVYTVMEFYPFSAIQGDGCIDITKGCCETIKRREKWMHTNVERAAEEPKKGTKKNAIKFAHYSLPLYASTPSFSNLRFRTPA